MAGTVNKVILIGNLGKDPEVRRLDNGAVVANFSIATSEIFTDKTTGERRENTDWHNIVAWRGLAEVIEKYIKKGTKIYVEGKLKTRNYQDKDGTTRYVTEVLAEEITILSRPDGERPSGEQKPNYSSQDTPPPPTKMNDISSEIDDDLPF